MKKRIGFVSNSSSSSFLIIGQRFLADEQDYMPDKYRYVLVLEEYGRSGSVDSVVFELKNQEQFDYALDLWDRTASATIYEVYGSLEGDSSKSIRKMLKEIRLPREQNVLIDLILIRKDYLQPEDFEELKEWVEERLPYDKNRKRENGLYYDEVVL